MLGCLYDGGMKGGCGGNFGGVQIDDVCAHMCMQARRKAALGRRKEEECLRRSQAEQGASHWLEERRSQELRKKTVSGRGHVT